MSLGLMLSTWLRVTQPCICLHTHVGSSGEGAYDTACPGNCHEETVDVPVLQTQEQMAARSVRLAHSSKANMIV